MFGKEKIKILIKIGIFILIFALIYISSTFNLFIHSLVNIFSSGRSDLRPYAFILFLIFLFALEIVPNFINKLNINLFKKIFISMLIVGFALNLASFIWYSCKYNIPIQTTSVVFNNNEISSNRLIHVHLMKGIVGKLSSSIGLNYSENSDIGLAYKGILPNWFYILGTIILLLLLVLTILIYYININSNRENRKFIYTLLYGITTFSVIEGIVDGGLFTGRVFISFAILLVLINYGNISKYKFKLPIIFWLSYIVCSSFFFYLKLFYTVDETINYILNALEILSIGILFLYYLVENHKKRLLLLLSIFSLITIYPTFYQYILFKEYGNENILGNGAIFGSYKDKINSPEYKKIFSIGKLNYYELPSNLNLTVSDIVNSDNININYYPVAVPWVDCNPIDAPSEYKFDILTQNKPNELKRSESGYTYLMSEIQNQKDAYLYNFDLHIKSCLTRHLNIIDEIFKSEGMNKVIIYNISSINNDEF